jgi:hypothetical protein
MVDGDIEWDACLSNAPVAQWQGDQAEQGGSCSPPQRQGRSIGHRWPVRWLRRQQGEDTQGSVGVKPSHRLVVEGDTHAEPLGSIP